MAANNRTKSKRSDRAAKRGEANPEVDQGNFSLPFPPNGYNAVKGQRRIKELLVRLAERLEKTAAEIEKRKATNAKTKKLLGDTLSYVQECLPSHNVDAAKWILLYDSGERMKVVTHLRESARYCRDWTTEGIVRLVPWANPEAESEAIRIAGWIDEKGEKDLALAPTQMRILEQLHPDERGADNVTAKNLADAVGISPRYCRTVIAQLREKGLVAYKRSLGYYRPDMPPKPITDDPTCQQGAVI